MISYFNGNSNPEIAYLKTITHIKVDDAIFEHSMIKERYLR